MRPLRATSGGAPPASAWVRHVVTGIGASALGLFAMAASGCGPSFQTIYEGDARFEHCYALEENPSLSMQAKAGCWDDWLKGYTYGQTRDRVDYAMARSRALRTGGEVPTDEAMMQAAPGEGRSGNVASTPRSAFAPPPKTLADMGDGGVTPSSAPSTPPPSTWGVAALVPSDAGATASRAAPPPPDSPLSRCTDRCRETWSSCSQHDPHATKATVACDKKFRACLRVCAR